MYKVFLCEDSTFGRYGTTSNGTCERGDYRLCVEIFGSDHPFKFNEVQMFPMHHDFCFQI